MKPMDLAAETAILDTLKSHDVSFTLISEESGVKKFGEAPEECFVTLTRLMAAPISCMDYPSTVALLQFPDNPMLGDVYAGMVADLVHGATYTAIKGKGAYRDGEKIKPSTTAVLHDAVIGLDLEHLQSQRSCTQTNLAYS